MGVLLSKKAAQRIGEAVRHIERSRVGGAKHRRPLLPSDNLVVVRIVSARTPGGFYAGQIATFTLGAGVAALDPASAATVLTSIFVDDNTGSLCHFINLYEYGLTTHALTAAENEAASYGIGWISNIPSTDNLPVVMGIGIPYEAC